MRLRLVFEWGLIVLFTCAVVVGLLATQATQRLDNVLYDGLVGLSAPPASDEILLVAIDDPSIAAIGKWPWPRDVHARFLQRIARAQASAVAYDVLFTEPGDAAQDEQLAKALAGTPKVVLPVMFATPGSNGQAIDVTPPLPAFARGAQSLGQVALFPDSEGVARSVPLSLYAGGRTWIHLMEATYRAAKGHPSAVFRRVSRQHDTFITIPFRPRSGDFRTASFASVLAGEVPPAFLKGRTVLVGMTATGLGDRFRVPSRTGGMISGIELQANVLNSLLANRSVLMPSRSVQMALSLVPSLLLLASFWKFRPSRAFAASVGTVALVLAAPVVLLVFCSIWFPPSAALAGLLVAYPLWGWRRLQAVAVQMSEELDRFDALGTMRHSDRPTLDYLDPVGGQAARLRAAIAQMREAQRSREVALEFLSHDMRSPQSSIITLLESNHRQIGDAVLAERVIGLARKTLRLADDFVHLARITASPFAPEDVDLVDLVTEAADELWPAAARGNVAIIVEGVTAAFVAGERDTLSRAFVNLLDNAVKFSPSGATVRCIVSALSDSGFECRIEDQGPGIPGERRDNLFASFGFRGSQKGKAPSSGLGLAFVGAAVARHKAAIHFEDCIPTGTVFVIRFAGEESAHP